MARYPEKGKSLQNKDGRSAHRAPEGRYSLCGRVNRTVSCLEDFILVLRLIPFTRKRLARIADGYDFITRAHVESVAGLARIAGGISGLCRGEARALECAAWLHDLGKSSSEKYLSILFTPRKLDYDDENLHRLMIEHAAQSENRLDAMGCALPTALRLVIRNHHRFLVKAGSFRDILMADPDFTSLSERGRKRVVRILDVFMVLDALCAHTEASRPSNWFDNIVFDRDAIAGKITKRYGDMFESDVGRMVQALLDHPGARKILEKNTEHDAAVMARTMKEWAENTSIYDVNYVLILTCQIDALKESSDLTGFKNFLSHLASPVFSVILWEKWAEELFSEIVAASLRNRAIGDEIRGHLRTIAKEHPHSLFAGVIGKYI